MLIIMTSPDAVLINGVPDVDIVQVLINFKTAKNPVGLISNHTEPNWFSGSFGSSGVQFLQSKGRQSGDIVSENAAKFSLKPFDVLVLATKDEDVQMGKNGGAILVAAGWSTDKLVTSLGIRVDNSQQLQEIIDMTTGWSGQWWFSGDSRYYSIRALADLSEYGQSFSQQALSQKLTNAVKNGGSRLNALLAITSRSMLMDGIGSGDKKELVWGVYPSSNSANTDTEILSDFTHRLRTTVSRVRYSKRGVPLFIRHKPSPKRSSGAGGDRTDPTDQILTIHINPFYAESKRLVGKHVIVIDDCTTYGVSFGVAAALLRKAGAASVTGVALGKFGNQLRHYEIVINSSPFAPITKGNYTITKTGFFPGSTSTSTKQTLQALIP
jgi:hypothetical protein